MVHQKHKLHKQVVVDYLMYTSGRLLLSMNKEVSGKLFKCSARNLGFRVPGEIKRSRDLRGGRWSWTLNYALKRS